MDRSTWTRSRWNGERLVLAAFVAEALLAGGNGVAVRFSNRELPPLWGASLRFWLAALLLAALMIGLKLAIPRGRALVGALIYGLLQFVGAFGLMYYALVDVQAGLGQTLLALVPLAALLLAVAQRQERLRGASIVGAILGLAGVALMSLGPLGQEVPPLSLLAILGSVLCFGQALVVVRRFPAVHPVAMNAVGMAASAAVLLGASALFGEGGSSAALDLVGARLRVGRRLGRGLPAVRLRGTALDGFSRLIRHGADPVRHGCPFRLAGSGTDNERAGFRRCTGSGGRLLRCVTAFPGGWPSPS